MNMLTHIRSLATGLLGALLLAGVFSACDRKDSEPFVPMEYVTFSGELFTKNLRLKEVVDETQGQLHVGALEPILSGQGLSESEIKSIMQKVNMYIQLSGECYAHAITYHTTGPKGEPIVASGMIYYPKSGRPKGVIEIVPWSKSKKECGTENYAFMPEIIPGMSAYVHIVADQVGYGATADVPIAYLQYDNVAVVAADMRRAAEEFVYNRHHCKLSAESILMGYSLGGGGALSLAQYYQGHPERGVKVKDLFIGGGVYDPSLMVKEIFASGHAGYAQIPSVICSFDHYDDLQIDFGKVFKGDLLKHYKDWCYGQYNLTELTESLGTDLRGYFTDEFLGREESEEYRKLLEICRQKKISLEQKPDFKIHLSHARKDELVPTSCSDWLYEELSAMGAEVEYNKYNANHLTCSLFTFWELWMALGSR
ncbi:hypothetical protein JN06_00472 [Bacteroides zoogleoformans]|uniref:Secretory lipase n=1 Tax=Bacteroides zoogleoformans TaxID=28119 RepID=A0ABN5IN28_9BACE|nr:hypothetical protein [Bacteroides zoogleoformans]AVM53173.1 hypothetical protein C4H11_09725 [Bacteroides zoogleoformans]TWJ17898.1 hypothetical protein JN06_00472 [Bacteroides zoogleoformans]